MNIVNDSVTVDMPVLTTDELDYKVWQYGEFTLTIERVGDEWIPAIFVDGRDHQDPSEVPVEACNFILQKALHA